MDIEFSGKIWFWKGPAPGYFVIVPEKESSDLNGISEAITWGWDMVAVNAQIGQTRWYSAMFPKDGRYILSIKADIRKAEDLAEGDEITVRLEVI